MDRLQLSLCAHPHSMHTLLMCTLTFHTHPPYVHAHIPCTPSLHARSHSIHTLLMCTLTFHAHPPYMHIHIPYTPSLCARSHSILILLMCTFTFHTQPALLMCTFTIHAHNQLSYARSHSIHTTSSPYVYIHITCTQLSLICTFTLHTHNQLSLCSCSHSTHNHHPRRCQFLESNSTIPFIKWSYVEHNLFLSCWKPCWQQRGTGTHDISSAAGLRKPCWESCSFWKCSLCRVKIQVRKD